ncbi:hypothetical protein TNIN_237901 [Trichonephila inaurata madagascariensis]|uniref:Uncharacterized protein n=2 Tax=Trichonephila inaurata madagascariensis TaxID=2747483 RepID=A0A8X7CHZ3_9ARAC|nr:hypothetical protein TNIN_237901 [Trichonephila inaurata madagascariensis]
MDPGNSNTSSDYSDPRNQWSSTIQAVEEKVGQCKIIFNLKENLFSSLKSDLSKIMMHDSVLKETELQNKVLNIQDTVRSVSEVDDLMERMKFAHDLAKDRLELINSLISQHDGRTKVRVINDFIKKFEIMASVLCDMTDDAVVSVTVIEEKVRALTETYGTSDSVK